MSKKNNIFFSLVCLPRTGSTLFLNVLNSLKNTKCFNQSFNNISLEILNIFYKKKLNKKKKILLNSYLFRNKKYLNQFVKFISYGKFNILEDAQKKNQYGESFKNFLIQKKNFNFSKFYKKNLLLNDKNYILGSKEVSSDYFINYYLTNKIKVILLVRNPFDYIYSCMYGKNNFINQKKYSINHFLLRWKYLYKHHNLSKKDLLIIKFEDLLLNNKITIRKLSKFLNTSTTGSKIKYINNSSHHKKLNYLDKKTIFYSLKKLNKKVIIKIFNSTKKELESLGYLSSYKKIKNFDELKKKLIENMI